MAPATLEPDVLTQQEIFKALEAIRRGKQELLPEDVVEAARDSNHVLHDRFEWNDRLAGHAYRLEQARSLIRTVHFQFTVEERQVTTVRYIRNPDAPYTEQGYRLVTDVSDQPTLAKRALYNELSRVLSCLERASGLADALKLKKFHAPICGITKQVATLLENL